MPRRRLATLTTLPTMTDADAVALGGEALGGEDAKLVVLARSARARLRAAEGAAVRDLEGRTYAAATVELPSLRLSALQVCVAMAVASGSKGLEAAAVLGDFSGEAPHPRDSDLATARDFAGDGVPIHLVDARGARRDTTLT